MSGWAPYTKLLISGIKGAENKEGDVAQAGIYGLEDGAIWDQTDGFGVTTDEVKAIVTGMKDNSKFQSLGLHAGGVKYMFTSKVEDNVQARKGVWLMARTSKKALLLILLKDGASCANNKSLAAVAKDLESKGF